MNFLFKADLEKVRYQFQTIDFHHYIIYINNMRRALLTASRYFYAVQGEKKNVFTLPKKQELTNECLNEIQVLIDQARSCSIIAATLKDNIELFTDQHIRMMYRHLRKYKLDADDTFHSVVAPISLQYIKCFNREQSVVFFQMLMYLVQLNVDNSPLQEAILHKLDEQNVYRYLPLMETIKLLNELLDRPDLRTHSLTKKLIAVVYQQKKFFEYSVDGRQQFGLVLQKLEYYQGEDPQLTEAYKQLA